MYNIRMSSETAPTIREPDVTPGKNVRKAVLLAQAGSVIVETNPADRVFAGSPSILSLPSGKLIAAADLSGPGVRALPGQKGKLEQFNRWLQGRIYVSGDKGETWTQRADFPFCNPCLFRDGATLYLLGHDDNLQLVKSLDGGETWSKPTALTRDGGFGDAFTQAPPSVLAAGDFFYAVATRILDFSNRGLLAARSTPVVLRAPRNAVLTSSKAWSFSSPGKALMDMLPAGIPEGIGIPLFTSASERQSRQVVRGRWAAPLGWSSAHLLEVRDENHLWHDPDGRTFHMLARGDTQRANFAILVAVRREENGEMTFAAQTTPAGAPWVFLPLPGGHAKFDIFYDEPSALYWLASNAAADSMTRPDRLSARRHGLACDEAQRLQLHFSRNLVDWSFAGWITSGEHEADGRHSCSMTARGSDLCVVCCAGTEQSRSASDTTRVTHHLIPHFRDLAY